MSHDYFYPHNVHRYSKKKLWSELGSCIDNHSSSSWYDVLYSSARSKLFSLQKQNSFLVKIDWHFIFYWQYICSYTANL